MLIMRYRHVKKSWVLARSVTLVSSFIFRSVKCELTKLSALMVRLKDHTI